MIYRKLLSFVFIAVLALGLSACDLIDVEPAQSIDADYENDFENADVARAALEGVYSSIQADGVYGGFFTTMGDFTADNAAFSGSFTTWQNARDFNVLATHGPSQNMWADHYNAINAANNVISRTPGLVDSGNDPEADESFGDRVVGEALFVRGLMHFNLVRLYGQPYEPGGQNSQDGVPIVIEPTTTPDQDLEATRSTVEEVYTQVISDLQEAKELLGPSDSGIRASQEAATALLAKVRLYRGQYAEAASLAEEVINSGSFELADPVSVTENGGSSSESIFAIRYLATDNTGVNDFPSSFYLPGDLGGRGDITVRENLYSLIEEGDQRGFGGLIYEFDDSAWTAKWNSSQNADDAFVLRLSEMYLIAAEGLARTGEEGDARTYLNAVRDQANASPIADDVTGSDLVDAIIQERRIELAFEGDRRHDLLRLERDLETNTSTAEVGNTQRIFPIPQRDIDVNSNLTQNPGY